MRHRVRGRKLNRSHSHRKAMFRNMAASLIKTVRVDEDDPEAPKVPGRITTTIQKAKELRPFVEKLITLARKAIPIEQEARKYDSEHPRNSAEWKQWRDSEGWQEWNQKIAPAITLRRRAFDALRDKEAVDILFSDLAFRFEDRPGGYTRIIRLAQKRLGDNGQLAFIEFVGERDRVKVKQQAAPLVTEEDEEDASPDESPEVAETETAESEEQTEEASEASEETAAATDEVEASAEESPAAETDADEKAEDEEKK